MTNSMTPEVLDVSLAFMEGLDSAHSLSVAIMLRYGEWDQIVSRRTDPRLFLLADDYMAAAAANEFLRKFAGLPTSYDLDAITLSKWWWAEKECFKTNRRLDTFIDRGARPCGGEGALFDFIEETRKNVVKLIGYGPPDAFDGAFGPGATVSDDAKATTVADKLSSGPTLTPSALFHLVPWIGTAWGKASAALGMKPSIVRGNIYFTVPKDSTTHRACGKEPSLNVFYQLGLGRVMRERMKKSGLDLDSGKGIHMRVACQASSEVTGPCTIDLTSASDCVSTALVELLMPRRWFSALSDLRSPFTEVEGRQVRLEKFSSMGNGFTFELETVLFASIVMTCMAGQAKPGQNMWVYGDDIIVPSQFGELTLTSLKWFGFTPNNKKTFLEGNFRESCGGDYFDGVSVRGHNLEASPNDPQSLISLANGISRVILQDSVSVHRKRLLRRAWFKVLDLIPSNVRRCRGPEWLGDIVIHDSESRWDTRWRGQFRFIRVFRPCLFNEVRFEGFAYEAQFAAVLYGVFLHQPSGSARGKRPKGLDPRVFHARGDVQGYKVGWANCP